MYVNSHLRSETYRFLFFHRVVLRFVVYSEVLPHTQVNHNILIHFITSSVKHIDSLHTSYFHSVPISIYSLIFRRIQARGYINKGELYRDM